jgi:5-methylcytosine-specific restriction endonuclease McrA
MRKSQKSGVLFPEDAQSIFVRVSGQRYNSLKTRLEKKKLPPPPFSKDEFRADMLKTMGGKYDGFFNCRYCKGYFSIEEIAVDHASPLSRGGSLDLSGLDYPCKPCNNRKGSLTHIEFAKLLAFLEKDIPLGRQDILKRLEQSVSLAAGARGNAAVIGKLKESGEWGKVQKQMRDKKKAKESGLGAF